MASSSSSCGLIPTWGRRKGEKNIFTPGHYEPRQLLQSYLFSSSSPPFFYLFSFFTFFLICTFLFGSSPLSNKFSPERNKRKNPDIFIFLKKKTKRARQFQIVFFWLVVFFSLFLKWSHSHLHPKKKLLRQMKRKNVRDNEEARGLFII